VPTTFSHETFLSPFTWRYGSAEMRRLWSEANKRQLWRRIWVALADAQHAAGLVSVEQVADLRAHESQIDLGRAAQIEAEIQHDLMAEVRTFAEQATVGGGVIHLGATSMDIEDNADALRLRDALTLVIGQLRGVLTQLAQMIDQESERVCMAFTHIQPAEPTTVGYRLASYAQDLLADYHALVEAQQGIRGKGFKGAVGTSASYAELLHGSGMTATEMETRIMNALGLEAFVVATQTYTRRQDWAVVSALAGMGMTLYKMAFDIRLLQSPPFGEWSEPFGRSQVGSSAMPFKRNPINVENIDSLARYLATLPRVAWDNGAHNLLERTLDDSANRRIILPEAFLTAEELLIKTKRILDGLRIDDAGINRNLDIYGTFAATERVLMEIGRKGGNRQQYHEVIREHSLFAWEMLRKGEENPLVKALCSDPRITQLVPIERIRELMRAQAYVGDAPERARRLAASIRSTLETEG
jgi:adenylosuccinate lyase